MEYKDKPVVEPFPGLDVTEDGMVRRVTVTREWLLKFAEMVRRNL